MRSFSWPFSGSALDRVRPWLRQLQQRSPVLARAMRWGGAAGVLAAIGLICYLGVSSLTVTGSRYLLDGRRFSRDDLNRITRVLDRQRTTYRIDDQRRIAIPSAQREAAEAAVAKLDLGPKLPNEIRDQAPSGNIFEPLWDREHRQHLQYEQWLESMIRELPDIEGAAVRIVRPKPALGLQPTAKPSAFVRLEIEGDRELPFRTVKSITSILTSNEPDLSPVAITVMDRRGHKYLEGDNPALSQMSENRAREEELSEQIYERLDWIKGLRIQVRIADDEANGLASRQGTMGALIEGGGSHSVAGSAATEKTSPVVAINRPLGSIDDPQPAPALQPAQETARQTPGEHGSIWVKVPRSYYYEASLALHNNKEPSREVLGALVAQTKDQIRTGIATVIPASRSTAWKVDIDLIPDMLPPRDLTATAVPSGSGRLALNGNNLGALGVIALVIALIAACVILARRPSPASLAIPRGTRFDAGAVATAGPSERVREFVRSNPESAVSVLERWTSQGGNEA